MEDKDFDEKVEGNLEDELEALEERIRTKIKAGAASYDTGSIYFAN